MSRIEKLYQQALSGRRMSFAEFQRLLVAFGFELKRVRGSHHIYRRDDAVGLISVQPRGGDAKLYQVRELLDRIEAFGLTLDEGEG